MSVFGLALLIFDLLIATESLKDDMITNEWHVVFHNNTSRVLAVKIAEDLGLQYHRNHLGSKRDYVFVDTTVPKYSNHMGVQQKIRISSHTMIANVNPIAAFIRVKRGYKRHLSHMVKRGSGHKGDPLLAKEWYIDNKGQAGGMPGLDLNVKAAWKQGFTGKGITTAIMDDGIDYLHEDIAKNFNVEASYDFSGNDPFPYPRYTSDGFNSHGTRCAGEIASIRGNGICGVGIAYNSKVAGLRILDQPYMTDYIEAAAIAHKIDEIDIYSASWGPTDDGKTVDGPRNETRKAMVLGVNRGRKGRGNIYVWASGDGGIDDDCNCDGYATSMWTISVNSATNNGETATYDESCSSTLTSTFSNGKMVSSEDAGVVTIDLYGDCTTKHSGTSAAAPEAAGVYALALEANPELTWRDIQHLTVLTSSKKHLYDRDGKHKWTENGVGLEFNYLFGFGVLDAGAIVRAAKSWKPVPERFHCIAGKIDGPLEFYVGNDKSQVLVINTDACKKTKESRVLFLEHVQAYVTLSASTRGDVVMFLTSPMKTTSMILSKRPKDTDSEVGFKEWPFMTTHTWGENPHGKWHLLVTLDTNDPSSHGIIQEWTLVLHGTQTEPYAPMKNTKHMPTLKTVKAKQQEILKHANSKRTRSKRNKRN